MDINNSSFSTLFTPDYNQFFTQDDSDASDVDPEDLRDMAGEAEELDRDLDRPIADLTSASGIDWALDPPQGLGG